MSGTLPLRRKLGLLFTLYFCQGLPGGFLAVVLPVILRERGMSLTTIGLASFLSLPWVLKVLWAPLVDRYASRRIGRRKSWILPAQAGMLAVTATFVVVEPEDGLWLVVALFAVLNLFAATQDIAVDGLAVDMLDEGEMGPGNAAQVAGFKLGNLFGGGCSWPSPAGSVGGATSRSCLPASWRRWCSCGARPSVT